MVYVKTFSVKFTLLAIFLLAILVRFLFFPADIYFGYDQARDAYEVKDILGGDIKLVGPSTSVAGLYHGVVYYYLIAPFYLISQGNPEIPSAMIRILNALGVIVIFLVGKLLFNKQVGFIAAFLYAISFEESQFSLYLSNPAPAALTIPLMFLGLAAFIFEKRKFGVPIACFCLGLSIQFEFALFYLIVPFVLILGIYFKSFLNLPIKIWLYSLIAFLLSTASFILAEFKYSFRGIQALLDFSASKTNMSFLEKLNGYFYTLGKMGEFNIYNNFYVKEIFWLVVLLSFVFLVWKKKEKSKLVFLSIWFFSLIFVYLLKGGYSDLYYTNIGISGSLLIFVSLLLFYIKERYKLGFYLILLVILIANLKMITEFNPKGTISQIHVQQGMLLKDEKKVVNRIYTDVDNKPFAVKGITLPYNINTTWSYLFEWYGQGKYGYTPVWNGPNALGYKGGLEVETAQEKAPELRYLVIEPVRGVPQHLIDDYLREESYFTKVDKEEKIGMFTLQKRIKI